MKDIKQYLHLYLGCEIETDISFSISHHSPVSYKKLDADNYGKIIGELSVSEWSRYCKPILRPLSSMTEEEAFECFGSQWDGDEPTMKSMVKEDGWELMHFAPTHFKYLLSKGFDLFGLIESGLAIGAPTLWTPLLKNDPLYQDLNRLPAIHQQIDKNSKEIWENPDKDDVDINYDFHEGRGENNELL